MYNALKDAQIYKIMLNITDPEGTRSNAIPLYYHTSTLSENFAKLVLRELKAELDDWSFLEGEEYKCKFQSLDFPDVSLETEFLYKGDRRNLIPSIRKLWYLSVLDNETWKKEEIEKRRQKVEQQINDLRTVTDAYSDMIAYL